MTKSAAAPKDTPATLTCSVTFTNTQVDHDDVKFEWYIQDPNEVLKTESPTSKASFVFIFQL